MTGYSFNLSERGRNGINRPFKLYNSIAYYRDSLRRAVLYPLSYGREPQLPEIRDTNSNSAGSSGLPGPAGRPIGGT